LATTWLAAWRRPSPSASGFLGALVVALLLAGCDRSSEPGPSAGSGKQRFDSNGGHYTVEVQTAPPRIVLNQPFDVAVTVTPKSGAAKDLEVLVDARMPAHFHGMNRVAKVTRVEGGWKAEGLVFHMPGHWELYVDITEDGVTERAQMDVNLK